MPLCSILILYDQVSSIFFVYTFGQKDVYTHKILYASPHTQIILKKKKGNSYMLHALHNSPHKQVSVIKSSQDMLRRMDDVEVNDDKIVVLIL